MAVKRYALIFSSAALTVIASSQAQAGYKIIRWSSGFCQIWDDSTPWKPFPSDYKTGRVEFKSFAAATVVKAQLIARRQCW
jgi:hypothetical protein